MRTALLAVALAIGASASYPLVEACGDKFLMVGRGARFQRAYASIHPGKLLIYVRPTTDPKAAVRDPQLHKALRQAGHAVSVIEDWPLLEQALRTVSVDVLLVDAKEAGRLKAILPASSLQPDVLFIAFPAQVPADVVCRLKSTDRPLRFLDEIEQAMKARKDRAKRS